MTSIPWLNLSSLILVALTCPLAGAEHPALSTPRSLTDLLEMQRQIMQILPNAKKATVAILGEGSGTGVIVSADGLVLTAGHVIGNPGSNLKVILSDGKVVGAKALGLIRSIDAGMVRLPKGRYPFAPMTLNATPSIGSWCLALGHPSGPDEKRGPVVRIGRVISRKRYSIRTDCKLIGGDSGGPLLNFRGEIVGIHSRISRAPDQNFHVTMKAFTESWDRIIMHEKQDTKHLR